MLASEGASINIPAGLNNRFVYFSTRNFFVRGGQELRDLESIDFSFVKDSLGDECLR